MSKQPIKSEMSVAGTKKVEKEVKAELKKETEELSIDGLEKYMKTTGGTRDQRLAEAKRLWEKDQATKK